jgi:uncharacterized membrane protein
MAHLKPSAEAHSDEVLVEMSRLNGLSDGVFAIALTLLVLDLRPPEGALAGDLSTILVGLAPKALIYLISFVVIGGAWGSHQRMVAQIKRGDGLLVWLNLFSLLFVSVVPATAALLGRFPNAFVPAACFAVNVVLIQLTAQWLWQHASRHGLTTPLLDARVVASIGRRLNLSAIVFGLSIPLALLNTTVVFLIWLGTFALLFTTDWLSWQQALKRHQASIPLEGARRARVRLQHWGGRLRIGANTATPDLLQGVFGGGLESKVNRSDAAVDVALAMGSPSGFMSLKFPWAWGPADLLDWTLGLRPDIPIVLEIESASGLATLQLGALRITELIIQTHAGSMEIELPANAAKTSVNLQASTSSLVLHIPPEVGGRIATTNALSSAAIDLSRFPITEQAGVYQSANYEAAANQVDIHLELASSAVKVD